MLTSSQVSRGPPIRARAKPRTRRCTLSAPPVMRGRANWPPAAACVTMCTSMSPDSRITVAPIPGPVTAAARRPRRLTPITSCVACLAARELDERAGYVIAHHLVVAAAEGLDQGALLREQVGASRAQAVLPGDVHGEQLATGRPGGDARPTPDQGLALRSAGQCHHDPFAGLPGGVDAVLRAVVLQCAVDLIGQPQQCQFAQRGEVSEAEVVREGRVDPLGGIDRSRCQPVAQRLRGEVDDFDLVGRADHPIGKRLALHDAGDLSRRHRSTTRCAGC